ncbi:hypothetical protein AJ80_06975 [Polytolypa hystricis UAMH7299]|uniref:Phosphatidylethanolamine-binding protein n=1 Tax=Polytolypa hystricis (strain UAMH7299) TaxID=1447883 RepID=A0A2B7XTK2_POLH7|nr:hypothetical protein AJ80_06975 [Polytolypa hystricis UAMH7299]
MVMLAAMNKPCFLLAVLMGLVFPLVPRVYVSAAPYDPPHQQAIVDDALRPASAIRDALRESSIIPDVLDDFTPSLSLTLTYPSTHSTVELGNTLRPSLLTHQPVYQFHPFTPTPLLPSDDTSSFFYTLILTDPDAKSRKHPIWSEYCHWILTNASSPELIHHHNTNTNTKTKHRILKKYLPPSPPPGTGLHRYVFVLLRGETGADRKDVSAPKKRRHWGYGEERRGVRDWAAEYGLVVVGANFFYARHEGDWV